MEAFLQALLSYVISLAANERTAAIHKRREERLQKELQNEESLQKSLAATSSLRQEIARVAVELGRNRATLGMGPSEEPVWRLLLDEVFQADLANWLMAGGIAEGYAIRERLTSLIENALSQGGAGAQQIAFLKDHYFQAIEHEVFSNPVVAHWRHQLSLDYLREQVAFLRKKAEEAAGIYSPDKQRAALDRYCALALKAWDIIDLRTCRKATSTSPRKRFFSASSTCLSVSRYKFKRIPKRQMKH